MSGVKIGFGVYSRATHNNTIELLHARFFEAMMKIGPPLGWRGLEVPAVPDCGKELVACYSMKYPIPGMHFFGTYKFRGERYIYRDEKTYDDSVYFEFKPPTD